MLQTTTTTNYLPATDAPPQPQELPTQQDQLPYAKPSYQQRLMFQMFLQQQVTQQQQQQQPPALRGDAQDQTSAPTYPTMLVELPASLGTSQMPNHLTSFTQNPTSASQQLPIKLIQQQHMQLQLQQQHMQHLRNMQVAHDRKQQEQMCLQVRRLWNGSDPYAI